MPELIYGKDIGPGKVRVQVILLEAPEVEV